MLALAPPASPPPFAYSVSRVTAAQLPLLLAHGLPGRRPRSCGGCGSPTGASTGGRTRGALVVNVAVVPTVVRVFRRLYAARSRSGGCGRSTPTSGSDERSLDDDNTAGFNCRYAVGPGPKRWSVHAFGLAIDVNPVENPYLEGGRVHPQAGARYLDRSRVRRGMAVPGGAARQRLRRGGLAVGRPLDGLARLPALLEDRRLSRVSNTGQRQRAVPPTAATTSAVRAATAIA